MEQPGWRDERDEESTFGEAAARAAQLNVELGLPQEAALMQVHTHHTLAMRHATQVLKARGEADPYGGRARQMARSVMEARAAKERLRATHALGDFARYSRLNSTPSTPFAVSAGRDFAAYAASNAIACVAPYSPSIGDHPRVPPADRCGAWNAAMDMVWRGKSPCQQISSAHSAAHPLRY